MSEKSDQDQTEKVRRDGKVSLLLIREVTPAGKRAIAFQHELIRHYESRLDNPEVLVTLENGTASMIVSGFANKPGKIDSDRSKAMFQ